MDESERKALADIEQHGCHVIQVYAEGDLPPFSYTIGVYRTRRAPEAIIIGLKDPIAHFVLNEYNRRIRDGETFEPGSRYSGFLEGFDVAIGRVAPENFAEYLGWDLWLYGGPDFEAVQIVYPTTRGVWPWDASASEDFKTWQPLLA